MCFRSPQKEKPPDNYRIGKRSAEQFDYDVYARSLRREALGAWEYHRESSPSFWQPGPGGSSKMNFWTGDYPKLQSDPATKGSNGAPKPPGVSAEPAYRTWEHRF